MGSFIIHLLLVESSRELEHRDLFSRASIAFYHSLLLLTLSPGDIWFHDGLTHASIAKPTVIEAEHDESYAGLEELHCSIMEANDRLELGLPLKPSDRAQLGYTVAKAKYKTLGQQAPNVLAPGTRPKRPDITPAPLFSAVRGKEMALAFKCYCIRVSFATQGHCLWIPNAHFNVIVAQGTRPFGESGKGQTYSLPPDIQSESPSQHFNKDRHIRIAMSFRGPTHTLVFVDHNMLMRFHITKFTRDLTKTDLTPGSEVWPLLWGKNHGPDVLLEPELWSSAYEDWLDSIKSSNKPLLRALLDDKKASNGLGEWQGTDVLARAALHPLWTASLFAACESATNRLKQAIIDMAESYNVKVGMKTADMTFTTVFDFEAKGSPYDFCDWAHQDWLEKAVFVYRKSSARVSEEALQQLRSLNLLGPYFAINTGVQPSPVIERATTTLQVFLIKIGGKSYYTHLEAFPEEFDREQATIEQAMNEASDVRAPANSNIPTLGPYSFQLFHGGRQSSRHIPRGRPQKESTSSGAPSNQRKSATTKSSARYQHVTSTARTAYSRRGKRKAEEGDIELSASGEGDLESEHLSSEMTEDEGPESSNMGAKRAKLRRRGSSLRESESD
ncbi:hypothetical protein M407DRAFT_229298 [Tulasnella calospora MUT 4182]|uniref:Uncharacterized protein n=1 Tax=Tulasnella calospora MUT 4182 TaxID=1051891 RepID=A0A0C3Q3D2_9AGAM|nr:hypothetical protein M407DRAFT_229298 [Tulasnella calospora MUT 4182]